MLKTLQQVPEGVAPHVSKPSAIAGADTVAAVRPRVRAKAAVIKKALKIVVIVVPLMIALSKQLGINSALLAIPAGITSSLSFILVTSAPANVIVYASGYFTIRDMVKAGLLMTIWASAAVTVSVVLFGRFCGIVVF